MPWWAHAVLGQLSPSEMSRFMGDAPSTGIQVDLDSLIIGAVAVIWVLKQAVQFLREWRQGPQQRDSGGSSQHHRDEIRHLREISHGIKELGKGIGDVAVSQQHTARSAASAVEVLKEVESHLQDVKVKLALEEAAHARIEGALGKLRQ